MRHLRSLGASLVLLTAMGTLRADNVFTAPGGDLTNPANWSDGVVPSDQGFIDRAEPISLSLGSNLTGPVNLYLRSATSASVDLQQNEWNNTSVTLNPHSESYLLTVKNGSLGERFSIATPIIGLRSDLNLVFSDIEATNSQDLKIDVLSVSQTNVSIRDGSTVEFDHIVSKHETTVTVDGASRLKGTDEDFWSNNFRFDNGVGALLASNLYQTRLNIKGESQLAGAIRLDAPEGNHVTITDGSTTDPSTRLLLYGNNPNRDDSVEIAGNNTAVTFRQLVVGGSPQMLTSFGRESYLRVADGAKVTFLNNVTLINPAYGFFATPLSPNGYNHISPSTEIFGRNSSITAIDAPLATRSLSVTNGAKLVSNLPTVVTNDITIRDATIESDVINPIGSQPAQALFGPPSVLTIERSTLTGNVSGYGQLVMDDAQITGNVSVIEIIGDGKIDGSISNNIFTGDVTLVNPHQKLEITGDAGTRVVLQADAFGSDIGNYDQLMIHGALSQFRRPMTTADLTRLPGPIDKLILTFSSTFRGSFGDRLELLTVLGTDIGIDHLLQGQPLDVQNALIDRYLNDPIVTGLPTGYAFNFFVTSHTVGIEITAVPEISSPLLAGAALLAALATRQSRRRPS